MPDDPEPPRKTYGFKAREFERVNSPGGPPIDVRQLVRDAVGPDPGTTSPRQPAKPENEVHTMLQENLARANAAGLNEVVPVRRRSRRRRDYLFALITGNLVFAGCTFISLPYGAAGLIIYNTGLAWVMWVVMNDY